MRQNHILTTTYALSLNIAILGSSPLMAAAINPGDFSPAATVTTFENLGLPTHGNSTPYTLDGNTYTTDNGTFRYLGPSFCPTMCLGTDTDTGFFDIALGSAYKLAGLYVGPGANNPNAVGDFWSASVDFFDSTDSLLGTVLVSGGQPATLEFAGWGDASGIARIRVNDTASNGLVMLINDVTFETAVVPVPVAAWLFGSGLLGLIGVARYKKPA